MKQTFSLPRLQKLHQFKENSSIRNDNNISSKKFILNFLDQPTIRLQSRINSRKKYFEVPQQPAKIYRAQSKRILTKNGKESLEPLQQNEDYNIFKRTPNLMQSKRLSTPNAGQEIQSNIRLRNKIASLNRQFANKESMGEISGLRYKSIDLNEINMQIQKHNPFKNKITITQTMTTTKRLSTDVGIVPKNNNLVFDLVSSKLNGFGIRYQDNPKINRLGSFNEQLINGQIRDEVLKSYRTKDLDVRKRIKSDRRGMGYYHQDEPCLKFNSKERFSSKRNSEKCI